MTHFIARSLLEIGAVTLRANPPFRWASGRFSPIYCDNRLIMGYPEKRRLVAEGFAALIGKLGLEPEVIAGTATAGIPHAAWLAERLSLPMVYVRGAAKEHGKQNRIEGRLEPGKRVVLIEDLISTGGSSVEAAHALLEGGANLLAVTAIFTYGLEVAERKFQEAGIVHGALATFQDLLAEAVETGALSQEDEEIVAAWSADPAAWSVARGGAG
ncbi:MAG: orotate phosphoribosyltransferase [Myxococcota bacterium]|jgi:orotate phosphoribosyltransferase|nr:orotate phosphoribosyltransferase [Myxococcota bacterium]